VSLLVPTDERIRRLDVPDRFFSLIAQRSTLNAHRPSGISCSKDSSRSCVVHCFVSCLSIFISMFVSDTTANPSLSRVFPRLFSSLVLNCLLSREQTADQ
jgi:hypothetical protein